MRFYVTVLYREPTFEQRIGRTGSPYRWTFVCDAGDRDDAVAFAHAEFEAMHRASGVGWAREIVGWDLTMMPPSEVAAI